LKNKTKKIIRITLAILLVVLIQAMGVTYAKYIASDNATGSAEVAKWAFQIQKEGERTKTIKLVDTVNTAVTSGKIAPGTSGSFQIVLDATGSEVDLEYELKFVNEQNKPKNLHFSFLELKANTLEGLGIMQGVLKNEYKNKTRVIEVSWAWDYETGKTDTEIASNDKIDTQDAKSIDEYTFDVVVTATQSE